MTGVTDTQLEALRAPTPAEEIKTRPGRGSSGPLSYVDARWVMERLDSVLGPTNWTRTHVVGPDGKVACEIGILTEHGWVVKGDGAGETDIEGEKGAFSDAFKRAAVNWGIARDLYGKRDPIPQHSPQTFGKLSDGKTPVKPQRDLRKAPLNPGIPDDPPTKDDVAYAESVMAPSDFQSDFIEKAQAAQATTFKASDALKIKVRVKGREKGLNDDKLKALAFTTTGKDSSRDWTVDDAERVLMALDGALAEMLGEAAVVDG